MLIKTITVGHLETNCYIVSNESNLECVVIDPGDESNTILDYIESNHLKCKAVFLTHGHYDHTGAVDSLIDETNAVVYFNEADDCRSISSQQFVFTLPENGVYIHNRDVVSVAGLSFTFYSTPGHTPGSVTIKCDNALFTGDTLFKGSCGRTDMAGGNYEDEMKSLKFICSLGDSLEVYPGHMESSSIIREKMLNYYCRRAINEY